MEKYRNNGVIGAVLDEYEKALAELNYLITDLTNDKLVYVVDNNTEDSDCKSIQTVLTHVIRAGYNYVVEIRKSFGENIDFRHHKTFKTTKDYSVELKMMFKYNELLFIDYPNLIFEEYSPERKILVKWGQQYDIEQLFEHAIVHILRHRRQIEKFLKLIENQQARSGPSEN